MTVSVLGLDASITETGIAHADGQLTVAGGDAEFGDRRLTRIQTAVIEAITAARPDLAVLEDLPIHAHGAGITGMAQGVIRVALLAYSVPYALVAAATLKKFATGNGGANKPDLRMALYKRTGIDERNDNKVDAWWLRAMGCQWLGEPVVELPKAQVAALDKVRWPDHALRS